MAKFSQRQTEAIIASANGIRLYPPAQGAYRWRSGCEVDTEDGCTPRVTLTSLKRAGLIQVCRDGRGGYELTDHGQQARRDVDAD